MISTIDCIQFLLKQGHVFHGHDESRDQATLGIFLSFYAFLLIIMKTLMLLLLIMLLEIFK